MAAPAAAVKSAMNCDVESVPTAPRGSARRNSIRNRPMLYKRRYIPARSPSPRRFFSRSSSAPASRKSPAAEKSCTGQSGIPGRSHAARRECDAEKALRRFSEAAPDEKAPDAPEALRERHTGNKAVHPAQKGERALPAVEIRGAETAHNAAVDDKALRAERAERIGAKLAPMRKHEKELRPGKAGSENKQNQGVDGLHVKLPLLGAPPDEQQRRGDADADAEPVTVHCETADRKKVVVHGYSFSGMRYAPHPLMRSSKHAPSP